MVAHPIKCKKFNYSVDMKLHQYGYQDALLRVSNDFKQLIITGMKFESLEDPNMEASKDLLRTKLLKS